MTLDLQMINGRRPVLYLDGQARIRRDTLVLCKHALPSELTNANDSSLESRLLFRFIRCW